MDLLIKLTMTFGCFTYLSELSWANHLIPQSTVQISVGDKQTKQLDLKIVECAYFENTDSV